jgi:Primase C terminal 1 (PriCT-1)
MLREFSNLFRGSSLAHGIWEKSTGNMTTVLTPATEEDYRKHLVGDLGLGIVPVNENGSCYFGAIDIDIDTVDHKELYARVVARKLPLTVCRSKSGGAHLYVFFNEPNPATATQALLKKWAGLLGFPSKTEIFPKQTRSTATNVGNWLNLPYLNAENTVRYAVNNSGSLDIEAFLTSIKYYTGNEDIDENLGSNLIQIGQMPPCLKELTNEGLPTGTRNVGLFSYGVFYRKSSPNGWADKLRYHNQNYVSPPLDSREVEALIKSLEARQYQYKCDEEPLCSHCDRKTCLTLPYGIGHKPWEDDNNFDEITVGNLRKILTDPPTYILEVNSRDIHLNSDEFRVFERLRKRIFEIQDAVIRPIKQQQWEQKIKGLLATKTDIEAPDDASMFGAVSNKIDDFLSLSDRSKGREDLLRGLPIIDKERVLFQVDSLQRYLISQKVTIANPDLYSLLHQRGCTYALIKIKGKVIRAWSIAANVVNKQTENYTEMEFQIEEPEI